MLSVRSASQVISMARYLSICRFLLFPCFSSEFVYFPAFCHRRLVDWGKTFASRSFSLAQMKRFSPHHSCGPPRLVRHSAGSEPTRLVTEGGEHTSQMSRASAILPSAAPGGRSYRVCGGPEVQRVTCSRAGSGFLTCLSTFMWPVATWA
ncbi:hypothetical protein OH77DRAFT_18389 [Trametes cingulata]|nr:hypothetical protein OH77DRAFT_18389 [Trametes cingulata]